MVDPGDTDAALAGEWLLTNGLGGYAMGTVLGANARRYHGLLVAAARPPVGRVLALHALIEELLPAGGDPLELSTQRFGPRLLLHPRGHRHLRAFELWPPRRAVWTCRCGSITVRRSLELERGANRARIRYEVQGLSAPARLRVRVLAPLRGFHDLDREEGGEEGPRVAGGGGGGAEVVRGSRRLRLGSEAGSWLTEEQWWRDLAYAEDRDRGQDWREDVYSPGRFDFELTGRGREAVEITVELLSSAPPPPPPASPVPGPGSGDGAVLHAAAGQFLVARDGGRSIIAGYPWFADWGRDTMIALPGLLLSTARLAEARRVLEAFAGHLREGLLPNCFLDDGACRYNAADAPLWFIHAVAAYAEVSGETDLADLVAACRRIVAAYRRGTRHGIRLCSDGLVAIGDGATPLTWMDAQREGHAFTLREGKPVEINALWHNALLRLAGLLPRGGAAAGEARELRELAARTARAFGPAFWWDRRRCLHDVLRPEGGGWRGDGRLRPNQILAASLPCSPLPPQHRGEVIRAVRDRLLTPFGLRTLEPDHPEYCGRYEGDLARRDAAYHNGTVWPWLIGPYLEAVLRAGGFDPASRAEARRAIEPLMGELHRGCLGQVAEVYDGEPPHRPSGCPAQAWSVAELLRIQAMIGG